MSDLSVAGLESQLAEFAEGYPGWNIRLTYRGEPAGWFAEIRRPDIERWIHGVHAHQAAEAVRRCMALELEATKRDDD